MKLSAMVVMSLSKAVRIDLVGGGRNESQFAVQAIVQPLAQTGAENNFMARLWNMKFGG